MIVDGDEPADALGDRAAEASMGPSMIVDGDFALTHQPRRLQIASMGPSVIVDGDIDRVVRAQMSDRLQWAVDDHRRRPGVSMSGTVEDLLLQMGPGGDPL